MHATKAILAVACLATWACGSASTPNTGLSSLAPAAGKAAKTDASNVLVTNAADQPVPITAVGTASVNVANTPTVNAAQSGTWTVGIDGTANVNATIASSVTLPVTVSNTSLPISGNVGVTGSVTTTPSALLSAYPQSVEQVGVFTIGGLFGNGHSQTFDVSRFKRIRVGVLVDGVTAGTTVQVFGYESSGAHFVLLDGQPIDTGRYTAVFDTPPPLIQIGISDDGVTGTTARAWVWGRPD
jgi:hypothetical protein